MPTGKRGKVYPTLRGCEAGKRALLMDILQQENLDADTYGNYVAWYDSTHKQSSASALFGCNGNPEPVEKRYAELEKEWSIHEVAIEIKD